MITGPSGNYIWPTRPVKVGSTYYTAAPKACFRTVNGVGKMIIPEGTGTLLTNTRIFNDTEYQSKVPIIAAIQDAQKQPLPNNNCRNGYGCVESSALDTTFCSYGVKSFLIENYLWMALYGDVGVILESSNGSTAYPSSKITLERRWVEGFGYECGLFFSDFKVTSVSVMLFLVPCESSINMPPISPSGAPLVNIGFAGRRLNSFGIYERFVDNVQMALVASVPAHFYVFHAYLAPTSSYSYDFHGVSYPIIRSLGSLSKYYNGGGIRNAVQVMYVVDGT